MSAPTTPLGSKPSSPGSTPQKRKRVSVDSLVELFLAIDEEEEDIGVYKAATQKLKATLNESGQLTPTKRARLGVNVTQASSLKDLSHVVAMFGLEYHQD